MSATTQVVFDVKDLLTPLVTTLSITASIAIAIYGYRRSVSPGPARLKHDLEVLKLARDQGINTDTIEAHIRLSIQRVYPGSGPRPDLEGRDDLLKTAYAELKTNGGNALTASVLSLISAGVSIWSWNSGVHWLAAIFFVLSGFIGLALVDLAKSVVGTYRVIWWLRSLD